MTSGQGFPVVPTKARRAAWRNLLPTTTAVFVEARSLHAALRALVGTTGKLCSDLIRGSPPSGTGGLKASAHHAVAAADAEHLAGDPAAVRRGQHRHHGRDGVGQAQ